MTRYKLEHPHAIMIAEKRKVFYTISKKHRGKNPEKSIWSITMSAEVALFQDALKSGYEDKDRHTAWNLYITGKKVCVVGYSVERKKLKIGKFVDSNKNDQWHGYPANYIKNIQDIPPTGVLLSWQRNGYITTATMKKIKGGQPCNL